MIFQKRFILAVFSLVVSNAFAVSKDSVVVYNPSQDIIKTMHNDDFSVMVRKPGGAWKDLFEYGIKVDQVLGTGHSVQKASMAYFDFSGTVEVSVTSNKGAINKARIRPLSYGIEPKINGNTISFSLSNPANLSVEINDDIFHNLHLFANPIEKNKPNPSGIIPVV